MELEVSTAVLWKKSDQIDDFTKWTEKLLSDKSELLFDIESQGLSDKLHSKLDSIKKLRFFNPHYKICKTSFKEKKSVESAM